MINIKRMEVRISNLDHITNSYIIYDEDKNAVLIDPGDEKEKIINFLTDNKLNVKYIFITHVHADHVNALVEVKKYTNAKIVVNEQDIPGFYDEEIGCYNLLNLRLPELSGEEFVKVKDNEIINCGKMEFKFLYTPGHTIGSMCIYEKNINALFTGDTIFSNCYGRCDLITSSFDKMKVSLEKIFNEFKDNTYVYPGHGESTLLKDAKKRIKLLIAIKAK